MIANSHSLLINTLNCITLHSDLVHIVEIVKIAHGRSWTLRRWSRMRNGEELGL